MTLPTDDARLYQRTRRVRHKKMFDWLQNERYGPDLMCSAILLRPTRHLLYHFFALTTAASSMMDTSTPLIKFANMQSSPAARLLNQYSQMLVDDDPWRLCLRMCGPWSESQIRGPPDLDSVIAATSCLL